MMSDRLGGSGSSAWCKAQADKPPRVRIALWTAAHALGEAIRPLGPLVRWEILDHLGEPIRRGHRRYCTDRAGVCEAIRVSAPGG